MGGSYMLLAARVIPFLLFGIIGYMSWVVTHTVVVEQYLNPGFSNHPNLEAGIALLVIYWTLSALVISSFARLLWTNSHNPGYLSKHPRTPSLPETNSAVFSDSSSNASSTTARRTHRAPRLSDILRMDVFVCQPGGMPRWCNTCRIWRPDRSRHCREKDRCVLKLDHFCPWVGGIVAETSMKFFIQFNTYTFIYTIFDWVLAAVLIAQSKSTGVDVNGNWIAMLILGLFFMGLTGGIGLSAIINGITNHTTVENTAEPAGHTWHLALRVRPGEKVSSEVRTVTFPAWTDASVDELKAYLDRSPSTFPTTPDEKASDKLSAPDSEQSTLAGDELSPDHKLSSGPTFAIVESDSFSNPWDVGTLRNWQQIMGHNIWDWFLPIRTGGAWSCYTSWSQTDIGGRGSEDGGTRSLFPTGLDVEVMRARAGLRTLDDKEEAIYRSKMAARKKFPYLLGGAGAPKKQWAASCGGRRHRGDQAGG